MRNRNAFTMIELIFVIVVMGIIGKFGVEFLAQAYRSFIFTNVNTSLQSNSSAAAELISARLEGRIKDSVIARTGANTGVTAIASVNPAIDYYVLEWVSSDIEGYRGTTKPYWSGIIDIDNPNATTSLLISPETNTTAINALIETLSNNGSGINDAALYFVGSNNDINGYGWDGIALTDQTSVMHPINSVAGQPTQFAPAVGNFSGIDIFEYYKLAWTANAVVMEDYNATTKMGKLEFYYDYQPWKGETFYNNGKHFTIMEKASTFRFTSIGSIIKIQVCAKSDLIDGTATGGYSLCKDKTIF